MVSKLQVCVLVHIQVVFVRVCVCVYECVCLCVCVYKHLNVFVGMCVKTDKDTKPWNCWLSSEAHPILHSTSEHLQLKDLRTVILGCLLLGANHSTAKIAWWLLTYF